MSATRRQWLAAGLAASASAWSQPRRELLMVTAVLPPYVLEQGDPLGPGMDIEYAAEALRLGSGGNVTLRQLLVPWRRALLMLESGEADFSNAVHITEERSVYLAYSQTYGSTVRHQAYARRGDGLQVRDLTDLQTFGSHRLGQVAGHAFPEPLRAAMGDRVQTAKDSATLLQMLAARRIDLAIGNDLPMAWLVKELGLSEQLEAQPLSFDSGRRTQMGFSKRRPDYVAALAVMDQGLRQLDRGPLWRRLQAHYLRA